MIFGKLMKYNFLIYNSSTKNIQIIKSESFQTVFETLFKKENKNGLSNGCIYSLYQDYIKEAIFYRTDREIIVYNITLFEKTSIDIAGFSS